MSAMTQERWDSLSDADKELLSKLGVTVAKEKKAKTTNPITLKRRRDTRTTCPEEEYWLRLTKVCDCCKSIETVVGKMARKAAHHSYLSLIECEIPEGEPWRSRRVTAITCKDCENVLSAKPVDDLVKMVIVLHEAAARRSVL